MDKWDGSERRKNVDKDWLERDRMLSEIHTDMKHLTDWAKSHDQSDNNRFQIVEKRITWIEKTVWVGIGGLSLIMIVLKLVPAWHNIK